VDFFCQIGHSCKQGRQRERMMTQMELTEAA